MAPLADLINKFLKSDKINPQHINSNLSSIPRRIVIIFFHERFRQRGSQDQLKISSSCRRNRVYGLRTSVRNPDHSLGRWILHRPLDIQLRPVQRPHASHVHPLEGSDCRSASLYEEPRPPVVCLQRIVRLPAVHCGRLRSLGYEEEGTRRYLRRRFSNLSAGPTHATLRHLSSLGAQPGLLDPFDLHRQQ